MQEREQFFSHNCFSISTESEVPPSSAVSEFLYTLYDLRDITKLQALILSCEKMGWA